MPTYVFDASFEGLLCSVFTAFSRGERPLRLKRNDASPTLFNEELQVATLADQADRVWNALKRRLSPGELNALAASFLSDDPEFETTLFRIICRIFSDGAHSVRDFSSPDIIAMLRHARRVNFEAHRVLQFMRFQKAADGTYFGMMEPAYDVMPQAVEHFRDRFSDSRFIIYDKLRHYGYSYADGTLRRIRLPDAENFIDGKLPEALSDPEEQLFQQLWRTYFNAIAIPERRNPRKQVQDMPRRFWKYLTEKNGINDPSLPQAQ